MVRIVVVGIAMIVLGVVVAVLAERANHPLAIEAGALIIVFFGLGPTLEWPKAHDFVFTLFAPLWLRGHQFGYIAARPSIETPADKIEAAAKTVAGLPDGDYAITAPTTMIVGEEDTVRVVVSTPTNQAFRETLPPPQTQPQPLIGQIKVDAQLNVGLTGNSDVFSGLPGLPTPSAFTGLQTWSFPVSAKSAGHNTLTVHIVDWIELPGEPNRVPVRVLEVPIAIHSKFEYWRKVLAWWWAAFLFIAGNAIKYLLDSDPIKAYLNNIIKHIFGV